jgi:hypothetical protein
VGAELLAILQSRAIGRTGAGFDTIEGVLIEKEKAGLQFRLMKIRNDAQQLVTITKDDVMGLVDSGSSGLAHIANVSGR